MLSLVHARPCEPSPAVVAPDKILSIISLATSLSRGSAKRFRTAAGDSQSPLREGLGAPWAAPSLPQGLAPGRDRPVRSLAAGVYLAKGN